MDNIGQRIQKFKWMENSI